MQFIRAKRNKIYPLWVAKYYDLKIYVRMLTVTKIYHFNIIRSGVNIYSSIDHKMYFTEFEETVRYIKDWLKNNYAKEKDGQ